jgi:hypothetical protein
VWVADRFGRCFGAPASLYAYHVLNPMNYIPLRWLCRVMGMSSRFWKQVIVPLYSSVRRVCCPLSTVQS